MEFSPGRNMVNVSHTYLQLSVNIISTFLMYPLNIFNNLFVSFFRISLCPRLPSPQLPLTLMQCATTNSGSSNNCYYWLSYSTIMHCNSLFICCSRVVLNIRCVDVYIISIIVQNCFRFIVHPHSVYLVKSKLWECCKVLCHNAYTRPLRYNNEQVDKLQVPTV